MAEFIINDFSAGWCPSDSAVGGRKNALLKMENVELNKNGSLSLTGGTQKLSQPYPNTLHSFYHRFLIGTNCIYAADVAGNIFRSTYLGPNINIGTGGSTIRAAFGAAYDYVIICSGNLRLRDTGAASVNMGQVKATVAPVISLNGAGVLTGSYEYCQLNIFNNGAYIARSAPSLLSSIATVANKVSV